MSLYLDASALVKRYVSEPGTDIVKVAMDEASSWYCVRIGYVETLRAVTIAGGEPAANEVEKEWPMFAVVETEAELCQAALRLALDHGLGSLDALHLAAALIVADDDFTLATWDRRLHDAAQAQDLRVLPASLP